MDRGQFYGPLLVFDGDCGFCRAWVDYWKGLTSDRVNYAPFQEVGERFPQVSREEFASAVKLIMPIGEVRSGAHAYHGAGHRTGQAMDALVVRSVPASLRLCAAYRRF
jgi:hypothetical protein